MRRLGTTACGASLAAVLLAVLLAASALAASAEPPIDYRRTIILRIVAGDQNPVPGATVHLFSRTGRLEGDTVRVTGDDGQVRVVVQPVIEDLNQGHSSKDRFLAYHTEFLYSAQKDGHVPLAGHVTDRQEFTAYLDPLYQGLDRRPTEASLYVTGEMPAFRDFLDDETARHGGADDPALQKLITVLWNELPDARPLARSITWSGEGPVIVGLSYQLLFDPGRMGLIAAAVHLLHGPVWDAVTALRDTLGPDVLHRPLVVDVEAGFQYVDAPRDIPEPRMFRFRLEPPAAEELMAGHRGQGIPAGIAVTVQGQLLQLSGSATPEGDQR